MLKLKASMTGIESFIISYPFWIYFAVFLGVFIDGEITLLLASIFAWQGYLSWPLFAAALFAGLVVGDSAYYGLGYFLRDSRLGIFMKLRFSRYHEWLDKNFMTRYWRMAFFSKFLAYVNRLTPIIAGWHRMNYKKFLKIHITAGIIWLAVMLPVGYGFGYTADLVGIKAIARQIVLVIIVIFVVVFAVEYFLKKLFTKKIQEEIN